MRLRARFGQCVVVIFTFPLRHQRKHPPRCPTSTDRIIDANSTAKPKQDVRYNQTGPDKPEESSYLRSCSGLLSQLTPQKSISVNIKTIQNLPTSGLLAFQVAARAPPNQQHASESIWTVFESDTKQSETKTAEAMQIWACDGKLPKEAKQAVTIN